jgi:hypothetical protein
MPTWFRTRARGDTRLSLHIRLLNAENWIIDDGFVERLRYEIDSKWQGVPVTSA